MFRLPTVFTDFLNKRVVCPGKNKWNWYCDGSDFSSKKLDNLIRGMQEHKNIEEILFKQEEHVTPSKWEFPKQKLSNILRRHQERIQRKPKKQITKTKITSSDTLEQSKETPPQMYARQIQVHHSQYRAPKLES